MLRVEGLNAGYGEVQILWDLSLEIPAGSITALIGSNGVGKTTCLRALAGGLAPYSGRILYEGQDISSRPQSWRARHGIMMIPEGRQLYSGLSVEDNLRMGAYTRHDRPGVRRDLDWVYTILPVLRERRRQLAGTLSGGEAQMCAIGRGLMAAPRLLLLDELSLGLAPVVVDSLVRVLTGHPRPAGPHHPAGGPGRADRAGAGRPRLRARARPGGAVRAGAGAAGQSRDPESLSWHLRDLSLH